VELVPWSVAIDHEDLEFATNSSDIDSAEEAKLKDSLDKIAKVIARSGGFMALKLYIAGHTDTVGSAKKNRDLSQRRARSIAEYMRAHGVAIPIMVAGFGEEVLKVKTPDKTDMRANRRVDYVLGPASGAPPFGASYQGTGVRWRQLP
jgi:outer membrane protein OmpA-like peptidoglycan-associated protein